MDGVDLASALASGRRAEVEFSGVVQGSPRYFMGTHTHCEHEEFQVSTASGPVDVIDNVDLAPRVALSAGDRIDVKGELVRDPGKEPIVHWTHHDPQGVHGDGFIRFRGRVYA